MVPRISRPETDDDQEDLANVMLVLVPLLLPFFARALGRFCKCKHVFVTGSDS